MEPSLAHIAVTLAGLAASASAQQFELAPGDLEYRIVANNRSLLPVPPGSDLTRMALQVRYVGGDARVASLGAIHGRIVSNELDSSGILTRNSVRQAPYGNNDFGLLARQGITQSHRELFTGGATNNNADENGGNPAAPSAANPHNGGGEFRWAPGLAGFGNLLAFDNPSTAGVGRSATDSDGVLVSVGLIDDNNGSGDDTGIEPTGGQDTDLSRWDTIFLFQYTATEFTFRLAGFDFEPLGSPGNPGTPEDTVVWWDADAGVHRHSNAALGVFRDDLSDDFYVGYPPAPGTASLLALGGMRAVRRRRGD